MNIAEKLNKARTRMELLVIGREIHRSIDIALRPSLQHMINERKVTIWSRHHRRARQDQDKTLQRLHR